MTKPKKPTEGDLMSIIQQGFNTQREQDLAKQKVADVPVKVLTRTQASDASFVPRVKISPMVPLELKNQMDLYLLTWSQRYRSRFTLDAFCTKAISNLLTSSEAGGDPWEHVDKLSGFLRTLLKEEALTGDWVSQAKSLLDGITDA
jgi:hypothetical protein